MGSPFNLVFYTSDSARANLLAKASFELVDSLNNIFSDYLEDSELNRVSRKAGNGTFTPLSSPLFDVLFLSKKASLQSKQSFDITIGPLSKLWRRSRKEKRFPSEEEVSQAKSKTGIQHLLLDTVAKTVLLSLEGMQLDLGGIAKGYAAQKVVELMKNHGVLSVLADAGGDIAFGDPPPGKNGWKVGVNLPESTNRLLAQTVEISHAAIATSGDLYQYMEHKGKKYSHIIHPKTGYGVSFQRNVTVIAPDGATADWLATACSILSFKQSKRLVKKHKAHLLITQLKKGKVEYHLTGGMKNYLKK